MNSIQIRKKFFDFFKKHNHVAVPSSSLIPAEDPTLLFTNAGMNQFKGCFLGKEKRSYTRAVSIQKCVRAGGKHNDLDEVGFTNRHLTFFEMMGNFSFGDYFKKEAIRFAWNFLTKEVKISEKDLVVSVYETDEQSYKIWEREIGLSREKIFRLGKEDNFWQMGDTGPCGPCSEIHVDFGEKVGCKSSRCNPSCECGRFTEIWNLVFMQYDQKKGGTLVPLKQTGIDTGMGFERLCMILQNKSSVFEIDLFQDLIRKIEEFTKRDYCSSSKDIQAAFNVICDHARASALLIADGCSPSNEGRGYVLRKIIRRAALFTQKLSNDQTLFLVAVNIFIEKNSEIYPELKANATLISKIINHEVTRFTFNLVQGQNIFTKYVEEIKGKTIFPGEYVFKLYDTYGFPPELTRVLAYEKNLKLDMAGFEKEMQLQREQSGKKEETEKDIMEIRVPENVSTIFIGYDELEITSPILFVYKKENNVWFVTEQSPFYVESGGQVGDSGVVVINGHSHQVKKLEKVGRIDNPAIVVQIDLGGSKEDIAIGDKVSCKVDSQKRASIARNHTATHLLQAALVRVLGKQVKQAGSLVDDNHLRFDFTHHEAMTNKQIEQVEILVNQKIQEDIPLKFFNTTLKDAQAKGVTAFFGEKYNPEKVRVVQIPGFSSELCGGTHVLSTGSIGSIKVVSEIALATGTRRIEAVTGQKALLLFQNIFSVVKTLSEQYKVKFAEVLEVVKKQHNDYLDDLRNIKLLKKQILKLQIPAWKDQVSVINEVPFLFLILKDFDPNNLKEICQEVEKKKPGFYFLISQNAAVLAQISFLGFVSKNFADKVDLKKLSVLLKEKFNLKGGGRAGLIQGGGVNDDIDQIKNMVEKWIKSLV